MSDLTHAVLAALDDRFVSTSVIKARAGVRTHDRIEAVLQACTDLERHGLAERMGTNSSLRWRRAKTANLPERA